MDIPASREVGGVLSRFGGGFGQIAQDGLAVLHQFEPFFCRCIPGGSEPEQAHGGLFKLVNYGFAGYEEAESGKTEQKKCLSKHSHGICNRFIMDG
jgi:hypothetical protein